MITAAMTAIRLSGRYRPRPTPASAGIVATLCANAPKPAIQSNQALMPPEIGRVNRHSTAAMMAPETIARNRRSRTNHRAATTLYGLNSGARTRPAPNQGASTNSASSGTDTFPDMSPSNTGGQAITSHEHGGERPRRRAATTTRATEPATNRIPPRRNGSAASRPNRGTVAGG